MGIIECVGCSLARYIVTEVLLVTSKSCVHQLQRWWWHNLFTIFNVYHPHEMWWHQMKHLFGEAYSLGYDWGRIVEANCSWGHCCNDVWNFKFIETEIEMLFRTGIERLPRVGIEMLLKTQLKLRWKCYPEGQGWHYWLSFSLLLQSLRLQLQNLLSATEMNL